MSVLEDFRLAGLPNKQDELVRIVTFNVNGIRTLFHYQPFSQMKQSLNKVFHYLEADVITFQELKIEKTNVSRWGKVDGYYSFISMPLKKKGYSGVGCWIRLLPEEHPLHYAMKVVKAEEGITGCLTVKDGKHDVRYKDNLDIGIGGYDMLGYESDEEALYLDSEGRCVMVELACNLVIISTYCPANSTGTEDGHQFRLKYLKVLFKRIRNLKAMSKQVILMGDLNVCRDLIDKAEALEANSIFVTSGSTGDSIETENKNLATDFILNSNTVQRRLFNQMLVDSLIPELSNDGCFIDTTRYIQTKKRLKMYTVWNTLKNTRPINYGSRIDFILLTAEWKDYIRNADILPQVMGSDHCPVYLDLVLPHDNLPKIDYKVPNFEAKYKYDLMHKNIFDMFTRSSTRNGSNTSESKSEKPNSLGYGVTKPSKRTKSIDNYFKGVTKEVQKVDTVKGREILTRFSNNINKTTVTTQTTLSQSYGLAEIPICKHGEECVLRTSKTKTNYGRKFWACQRPKGESNNKESSCEHFQWV